MVESDLMLPPTFTWAIPLDDRNTILSSSLLGGVGVDPPYCKTEISAKT